MNNIILTPAQFATLAGGLILPFFVMSLICAFLLRRLFHAEMRIRRLEKEARDGRR